MAEGGETAEEDGGLALQPAELLVLTVDAGDGQRESRMFRWDGGGDGLRWLQVQCGVCACPAFCVQAPPRDGLSQEPRAGTDLGPRGEA